MIEESLIKSNFLGRDGFVWWIGQIAPPTVWRNEKSEVDEDSGWAYRCKVRIVGYHTFDGSILPDEDLPWAHVMVDPVDGSGQAGLAKKHNLVGGETAFGFFLDGDDAQQPVVVGLIFRNKSTENLITPDLIESERSSQFKPFTGHQGNMSVKMTQKRPVKTGEQSVPTPPTTPPAIVGAEIPTGGLSPVSSTIPPSDPSADKVFSEDSALNAALKEAMSVKIVRENGCSDNAIGKITQSLQDFVAVINGLQQYQSAYIDPILNKVVDITSQIKSTASKIAGILKSIVNVMRSTIMGLISKLFRELVALIVPEPQVPPVAEASKNILNIIFCLFERLLDLLLDFLEDLLKGLVGRALSVPLCAAEEWIAAILGKLLEALDDLLAPILSGISWLTGALGQVSSILSTVAGIANKIISFIGCDQLKCETPSEWAMEFGPSQAEADSWSRVLDNLDVLKSFNGGIDEAVSYLSLYGYGSEYFPSCSEEVTTQEPPPGVRARSCRPPKVKIFGGGGVGASATPIVSSTGRIIGIEVTSGGIGYTRVPKITITDKSNYGKGAKAEAVITNGSVSSIYIVKPGRGYCPPANTSLLTSPAYYVVTADKYSIREGEIVTLTISGFQLNSTTDSSLSYEVTGVSDSDIDGAALSGNITLNSNGTFQLQFRAVDDSLDENSETMVFNLYDSSSNNVARASIFIYSSDSSPINWWGEPIESPPGNTITIQGIQGILGGGGTQGIQGILGDGGTQGIQGLLGTGIQGLQGISQTQGILGIQGILGTSTTQGLQGIQGTSYSIQGIQGILGGQETGLQGIQGTGGIGGTLGDPIPGTDGNPEVFVDGIQIVSPGTGYSDGDTFTIGGISTFIPVTNQNGSIIGFEPSPSNSIADSFSDYPELTINSVNGEGAAVFPILKLKKKFKVAPLFINQNGILVVVDCI